MSVGQSVRTWGHLRLVTNRHEGTFRSTTWRLTFGWGRPREFWGPSDIEFTWRHRR